MVARLSCTRRRRPDRGAVRAFDLPDAGGMTALSRITDASLGPCRQRVCCPQEDSGRNGMVRSERSDASAGQQSLGDLVAAALKDVSSLVRYEISLAKSELKM